MVRQQKYFVSVQRGTLAGNPHSIGAWRVWSVDQWKAAVVRRVISLVQRARRFIAATHFPKEYLDNAFVGDAGGNLVHRKVLLQDDVGLKAQRGPGEANMEFIASKDTWFRPVQFANAPDGSLYVIDMYRETIEHPWSLPPSIKQFLDLNSGNDRGRIYRVVPDGYKQPALPHLDKASTKELVATLESPNGWDRDTASRLLYERQDKSAVPALIKLLKNSKSPLGRLHALCALDGVEGIG